MKFIPLVSFTRLSFLSILFLLFVQVPLLAQEWDLIKEKDGIKIYTREEENTKIKAFKGEAYFKNSLEEVYPYFFDPEYNSWWAEDVVEYRLIEYKKDQLMHYYVVYNVQWPIHDRDLYVESFIEKDPKTGGFIVKAYSVDGVIPEDPDLVRIAKYYQQWKITPLKNGTLHFELEGFVDPGGSISPWLQNMMIGSTPMELFENLRELLN